MNQGVVDSDRLKQRVDRWAKRLKVKPRLVRVQKMTRKWGSCSTAGTLTFATDLCHQKEDFQDFVVAHELLHLRIPNHGRLFKSLMTAHVPNWRKFDNYGKSISIPGGRFCCSSR